MRPRAGAAEPTGYAVAEIRREWRWEIWRWAMRILAKTGILGFGRPPIRLILQTVSAPSRVPNLEAELHRYRWKARAVLERVGSQKSAYPPRHARPGKEKEP